MEEVEEGGNKKGRNRRHYIIVRRDRKCVRLHAPVLRPSFTEDVVDVLRCSTVEVAWHGQGLATLGKGILCGRLRLTVARGLTLPDLPACLPTY